jgi:hypothetical protein
MENKVSLMNVAVRNGIFLGLAGVLISVLVWLSGMNMIEQWWISIVVGLISITLSILFMRSGVITIREKGNEGVISFGQAFIVAFLIGIISLVFSIIWTYLQYQVLDPESVDIMIENYLMFMEGKGIPENYIIEAVENMEKMKDPVYMLVQNLKAGGFTLVVALLIAAFIKKDTTETGLS